MPSSKRLIVNADDFGLHPAINEAVARSHCAGIVSSASLMPYPETGLAFADALARLPEMPTLGLGLHFTLAGVPGLPPDYVAFVRALARGQFPASRIETLLRRQLDTLLRRGVSLDHLDSHQHLHLLPSVLRVVCRVLPEYGISAIRIPRDVGPYFTARDPRIRAARLLAVFAARAAREAQRAGLWFPKHFRGMAVSGRLDAPLLRAHLATLPEGVTELVCHPGADNPELSKSFDWGYDWAGELKALTDKNVAARLKPNNVELTTFSKR